MSREIKSGVIVRHFKGNYYRVITISRSTNNPKDITVVYQSMDGYDTVWSRPLEEFMSLVPENLPENEFDQKYRFEVVHNFNNPLESVSTNALIHELSKRSDQLDFNVVDRLTGSRFQEYVYGPRVGVTEENPLGIYTRGYTDDIKMLKNCLRIDDIVYKRVYLPVDVADLTEEE